MDDEEILQRIAERENLQDRLELLNRQYLRQKALADEFGQKPRRGWSNPYRNIPNAHVDITMPNQFWYEFRTVTQELARLEGRRPEPYTQHILSNLRPKRSMEWRSFIFDADTSELSPRAKGRLTRTFKRVMAGKTPLRTLASLVEDEGFEFDYAEWRRSYTKD